MKPWQAWTITICAILICVSQVYQMVNTMRLNYGMNKVFSELSDAPTEQDFAKEMRQMEESWKASMPKMPDLPKARAIYNPPQR